MNAAAAIRARLLAKYPDAALVARTLTTLQHRLPDLPDGRPHFAVDAGVGPLHYEDDTGVLQEIDDALGTDGMDGFAVRTGNTPHLLRMANTGKRRFYPNRYNLNRYVEFSALPSMGTPTRGENYLAWDKLHFAARIESFSTGVKFAFILKDVSAPTSISFNVALAGLTRQGRFLLANGVPVAVMRLPTAIDAAGTERTCTFSLTANKVTIALDTSNLVFPIEIDPSVDAYSTASADDAYYNESDASFRNDGNYVHAGAISTTAYQMCAGMRFIIGTPTVPPGVTITHAHFSVTPYGADAGTDCYTTIRGELSDTGAFSDAANFHQRRHDLPNNLTSAVSWGPLAAWAVDGVYIECPEIKSVIQGQVNYLNRGLATSVLFWDDFDNASTHSAGNRRRANAMETGATKYPLLHFDYTPHASFGQIF